MKAFLLKVLQWGGWVLAVIQAVVTQLPGVK